MKYCLIFLALLTGCADVTNRMDEQLEKASKLFNKPTVVEVKPFDREELRKDLQRGMDEKIENTVTQSEVRQQGAVNAQVNKVTDKIVGVEADFRTEMTGVRGDITGVRATVSTQATATAVMQTKLESVINANVKLEADLKVAMTMVNQLKLDNVEFKAQAQVSANAQIGMMNKYEQKIEDLKISAGGNVNMLPANAVWIILGVCGGMFTLMLVGSILGNGSERDRLSQQVNLTLQEARINAKNEREERQASNNLLLEVLAMLPAGEASKISGKVERLFKRPVQIGSNTDPT